YAKSETPCTCSFQIFVMNADGSNRRQLTFSGDPLTQEDNLAPVWSPDGAKLLFFGRRLTEPFTSLYTVNVDGTSFARVPNTDGTSENQYDWSPDGSRIAVSRYGKVWTVSADGSDAVR